MLLWPCVEVACGSLGIFCPVAVPSRPALGQHPHQLIITPPFANFVTAAHPAPAFPRAKLLYAHGTWHRALWPSRRCCPALYDRQQQQQQRQKRPWPPTDRVVHHQNSCHNFGYYNDVIQPVIKSAGAHAGCEAGKLWKLMGTVLKRVRQLAET